MPSVKIHTPGVSIEIEAGEISVGELSKQALELYRDAGGWPQYTGTAVGFTAERRGSYDAERWTRTISPVPNPVAQGRAEATGHRAPTETVRVGTGGVGAGTSDREGSQGESGRLPGGPVSGGPYPLQPGESWATDAAAWLAAANPSLGTPIDPEILRDLITGQTTEGTTE